jgi:translation initiation factor IF-3
VNERIKAPRVLVIDENGQKIGVMLTRDAIEQAREKDLDLVEVAPKGNPPVARMMDYGKHLYQQQKRDREARKKQASAHVKEVKLRIKTDEHDVQTKLRHMRKFLEHGDKVKLVVIYRGREMAHPELGDQLLKRVIEELEELGSPEYIPKREGRNLVTVIAPLSKAQMAAREKAVKPREAAKAGPEESTKPEQPKAKEPGEVEGERGA